MALLTKVITLGAILFWELVNRASRKVVTIANTALLPLGTVIGEYLTSVPTTGVVAGTGNGTCTTVTGGVETKLGAYVATCIDATVSGSEIFQVEDPDGEILPPATVDAAYANAAINFIINDGGTDFIVGDTVTITVIPALNVPSTGVVVGTGNGTCTGVTGGLNTVEGNYIAICNDVTTPGSEVFGLVAPGGDDLPDVTVDVAYTNAALNLTINDGSTNFIIGDTVTITVAKKKHRAINFSAVDGTQKAAGMLVAPADADGQDVDAVAVVKDAVIVDANLSWPSGATSAQKVAALTELKALGFSFRKEA